MRVLYQMGADAEAAPDGARAPEEKPLRLPSLPAPPGLGGTSKEEQKKRIKDLQKELRGLRKVTPPDEGKILELTCELEDLHRELAEEPAGADCDRLVIKREIREAEKRLKAHRRTPCLSSKELVELKEQLDRLKAKLERPAPAGPLLLSWRAATAPESKTATAASISLGDRAAFTGLSASEAAAICDRFAVHSESASGCPWEVWRHPCLRTGSLRAADASSIAAELEAFAVAGAPHLLCTSTRTLRAGSGICGVLRRFQGALVVVEEELQVGQEGELDIACLLHAVGVRQRWRPAAGDAVGLELACLPDPLQGEVVGELRWKDLSGGSLAPFAAEADALCVQEFEESLEENLSEEGMRLGLLTSAPRGQQGASSFCAPQLLGFITYKFWGPPLKAMSISRVAVPARFQMLGFGRQLVRWAVERARERPRRECDRATLSAVPAAVPFYERLSFTRVVDEEADGDSSKVRMEYSCGAAVKSR